MSLDIIQTLTDKKLLGQFLMDTTSWKAWLTFLKAFFALNPDPDAGDQELFTRCTGRATWPNEPAREGWLIIGTRGGKSFITALMAT
jgi:hypothetical protein